MVIAFLSPTLSNIYSIDNRNEIIVWKRNVTNKCIAQLLDVDSCVLHTVLHTH